MILSDKDIENLDSYWHNKLSKTDRLAMDNRLKMDADFKRVADEMRLITEGLEVVRLRKMKAHLATIEATLPEIDLTEETPVVWLNPRWWAVAATGLVLITAGMWFFRENTEGGLKSVAKDYFEAYPALGISRGNDDGDIADDALRTYAVNDFQKAIPLLQKSFQFKKDSIYLLYMGVSYLGMGKASEAEKILSTLQSSEKMPIESIMWYLALAYIELGQKEKAMILLRKTANTEGAYKVSAHELIKKME